MEDNYFNRLQKSGNVQFEKDMLKKFAEKKRQEEMKKLWDANSVTEGIDTDSSIKSLEDLNLAKDNKSLKMDSKEPMSIENMPISSANPEIKQIDQKEVMDQTKIDPESEATPMILPKFNSIDSGPSSDIMSARRKALSSLLARG